MTRGIGGVLDLAALEALSGAGDDARMRHFRLLDHARQAEAIRRLATGGHSVHTIARATGLAVEQVRRLLEVAS